MTVEDRLVFLLANFIHTDENAVVLEDPLWSDEGGPLETSQAPEFLDEIEGEFGIKLRDREFEDVGTVFDLLHLVQGRVIDSDV
jgi:acyl carrier protein